MSRAYKPGDLVRVVRTRAHPEHLGKITTVTSGLTLMRNGRHGYPLDLFDVDGVPFAAEPGQLEPYWEGKEASDKTLAEILSELKATERESA